MIPLTILAAAVVIALMPMFWALHRQTVRADRAEAALARVEAVIAGSQPTVAPHPLGGAFYAKAANNYKGVCDDLP